MDIEINNQCAAVVEPKNKKPEMPLRYQLEMELLASQNSRLIDQRNKLLDMVERLQSKEHEPFEPTASKLNKAGVIWLTHSYCVVFGDDGKQAIYQSMDGSIEQYRVCKVL